MPLFLHSASILTNFLFAGLWQGLAFASLGILMCALLSRAPASLRHACLVALFLSTLVVPCLHFSQQACLGRTYGIHMNRWVPVSVVSLWMALVLLRGAQLALAWRHLCAVRRTAEPVQVQGTGSIRAGGRTVLLCSSNEVSSPCILGFLSPRLLLPKWMVGDMSSFDLRQIALHEAEHLRRGDDWLNLIVQFGMVLSPLNPFLLWLAKRIDTERELAVDAAVVAHTNQPLAYASCLTRLAEQRLQRGRLRLALAAWERKSELVRRVHVLLHHTSAWTRRQSTGAAVSVAAVVLLAAGAIAHAPWSVAVQVDTTAVMAPQESASVAPGQFADRAQSHPELRSAQLVQASFHVETTAPAMTHMMRRMATSSPRQGGIPPPHGMHSVHLTEATAVLKRPGSYRKHAVIVTQGGARFVRAEFRPAYLALPTINGWLLFQL